MSAARLDDDAFERALLGSAREDGPSADATKRAWAHFAAGLAPGLVLTAAPEAVITAKAGWLRIAGWLTVGAIAGSGATVASLHREASSSSFASSLAWSLASSQQMAPSPQPGAAPDAQGESLDSPNPPSSPVSRKAAVTTSPVLGATSQRPRAAAPLASATPASEPVVASARPPAIALRSTLAAEIAALDAARGALERGALTDALARLERYRSAFPGGELAQEASLLVIEALLAQHDDGRLVSETDAFLRTYPASPSAGRVKRLRARSMHELTWSADR